MKERTRIDYEERLLRAKRFLEARLDEPLCLEEVARVACFSPFHFSRIYTAMTGETLMGTLRRLRLERAAGALRYSDRQVTDLALEAGYDTLEAFGRSFRRLTGMSPSMYRSRFRYRGGTAGGPQEASLDDSQYHEGAKSMEVKIQHMNDLFVAYVRNIGPYSECGVAWGKLCGNPAVTRTFGPDTVAMSVNYDDPDITDPDKIRMDACVSVPADFVPPEGIQTQVIEGGEFAVLRHVGSFSGLIHCYRHLYGEWLPKSGREPKGTPALEIYRTNPDEVPEDQMITEIFLPLKPR